MRLPKALRAVRSPSAGASYTREDFAAIRTNGPPNSRGGDLPDALRGDLAIDHSTTASTIAGIVAAAAASNRRRG